MSLQPSSIAKSPVLVLSRLGCTPELLQQEFQSWQARGEMVYNMIGFGFDDGMQSSISALVAARAFPTSGLSLVHRQATDGQDRLNHLEQLESKGLVACVEDSTHLSRWALTPEGMAQLAPARVLHSPTPAVCARPALPLADQSPFELLEQLALEGWQWERFKKKGAHAYVPGSPKASKCSYQNALIQMSLQICVHEF